MPTGLGPGRVRFAQFTFDRASGELYRDGIRVRLQEQPAQILAALLEQPGDIVTRDRLRERLWNADTFVDYEHGLNTAVKKLRQALGDSAEAPRVHRNPRAARLSLHRASRRLLAIAGYSGRPVPEVSADRQAPPAPRARRCEVGRPCWGAGRGARGPGFGVWRGGADRVRRR